MLLRVQEDLKRSLIFFGIVLCVISCNQIWPLTRLLKPDTAFLTLHVYSTKPSSLSVRLTVLNFLWCYPQHPTLWHPPSEMLHSAFGVQQGDPLGPLVFSLVLYSVLKSFVEDVHCNFMGLNCWYIHHICCDTAAAYIVYGTTKGLPLNPFKRVDHLIQHSFIVDYYNNSNYSSTTSSVSPTGPLMCHPQALV